MTHWKGICFIKIFYVDDDVVRQIRPIFVWRQKSASGRKLLVFFHIQIFALEAIYFHNGINRDDLFMSENILGLNPS